MATVNTSILKICFFAIFISLFRNSFAAENSRSDTIDITNYNIHLNVTDYSGGTIDGSCTISFKSKLDNISELDLDFVQLTVDSVIQNNQPASYTFNGAIIKVSLQQPLNTADSSAVTVYYHGVPQVDATGLGGFAYSGIYAFNIGVGFAADPHPYGRCWFPCFDNFVERSTYDFFITSDSTNIAVCNGLLVSQTLNADQTTTWQWRMNQTIPTYLACVDVGPFDPISKSFVSISGDTIPVLLTCLSSDSIHTEGSFAHLDEAFNIFESHFGPYRWDKVGYSMVPAFNSTTYLGMEHATNIAMPTPLINGSLTYEDVIAHELSHHWFGDLVTCKTVEDMWLNEGWATYCEKVYFESLYGEQNYKDAVAANHEQAVHFAHTAVCDGQYFALNNVPHDYSYTIGGTVYDKGADVVHTLRSYIGDSLFFHCVKNYLTDFAFSDAASEDLRDELSNCSGINLTDFFNDWVFAPGWAAFTIDSFNVYPSGNNFDVIVFVKQRLDHAPHYYQHVPLEVTFKQGLDTEQTETIMMSGRCGIFFFQLPFSPDYAGLDLNDKISDAVTADSKIITTPGLKVFVYGKMNLTVNTISDSAFVRIEHYYAPPDAFKNPIPNLHISQERYWKVDGIWPADFDASATVNYNGSTATTGYLDMNLISNVEDSLVLLYRPSPRYDWSIETDVTLNMLGSNINKFGNFNIHHLKKGEYAFGIYDHTKIDSVLNLGTDTCVMITIPEIPVEDHGMIEIIPNPASASVSIVNHSLNQNSILTIFDICGKQFFKNQFSSDQKLTIDTSTWNQGIYVVAIRDENNFIVTKKLLIIN